MAGKRGHPVDCQRTRRRSEDVDGWTKLDHAAVAVETMFLQKSNLTKDQGEWLNKSNGYRRFEQSPYRNQGKECR
jgi:hypothetical protein